MEESGPHKQSILRNTEVSLKNAPRKPLDVTRPTVMVKRLGFRGTLPVKYKIYFWNNPITASILVWNQVVLNQSQQLGYLNSKLMLSWDCPFNRNRSRNWFRMAMLCWKRNRNQPQFFSGIGIDFSQLGSSTSLSHTIRKMRNEYHLFKCCAELISVWPFISC